MSKLLSLSAWLAGVGALALVAGCAETTAEESESPVGEARAAIVLPPAPPGAVCVTIERGVAGNVHDADLSIGNGSWAAGNYSGLWTGGTSSPHWMVVKPDLSPIPPQVQIVSATFSVYSSWNMSSSQVRAHLVTKDWAEPTVSWPNFGGAASFEGATLDSFDPTGVGYRSMDVTAVVKSWYLGEVLNGGVLLEENAGPAHYFFSSESSNVSNRPRFDVCYFTGPCAGKAEGATCDDDNACTQTDTCQSGSCVGSNPVTCVGDTCHNAGVCNPSTGQCTSPAKADGSHCDDGNACTQSEMCFDGICTAVAETECSGGLCDPATGACPVVCPCRELADWHPFQQEQGCKPPSPDDASFNLWGDGGQTLGVLGSSCGSPSGSRSDLSDQEAQRCIDDLMEFDALSDAGEAPLLCACAVLGDGAACSDGDSCTHGDTCLGGACVAGAPSICGEGEMCSPQTGLCGAPSCSASTCANGGTCSLVEGSLSCECPPGYSGPACEIRSNPCTNDTCNQHGICAPTDAFTYTCACGAGWSGTNCEIPSCPCTSLDPMWAPSLGIPGVEVIPESLHALYETCDPSDDTISFADFRAYLPQLDATMLADFQTSFAALDPNAPDFCVTAHDLYSDLIAMGGVYSAGTITSTSNGQTTTTTVCMSTNPGVQLGALYVTTPDQNAACLAEIDAAGAGSVTPM